MVPILYLVKNSQDDVPSEHSKATEQFFRLLRQELSGKCDLIEGNPVNGFGGLVWTPNVPCDGLILVYHFRPSQHITFEIKRAMSSRRVFRAVPVLTICDRDLSHRKKMFDNICLKINPENYENWDMTGDTTHFIVLDWIRRHFSNQ